MPSRFRTLASILLLQGLCLALGTAAAADAPPSRPPVVAEEQPAPPQGVPENEQEVVAMPPPTTAPALPIGPRPGKPYPIEVEAESDNDLKEAARSALQWAHEAKQFILPARPGAAEQVPDTAAAKGGGTEGPPTWRETRPDAVPVGSGPNPIREVVKFLRELAGHPVTWMLIPIVAFGSAAVAVVKYRAQIVDKRLVWKRRSHRRHGPADPHRRHRQSPAAAGEEAPPAVPAPKKKVRLRVRRFGKPRRSA